jgi:hypothetical protein
MNQGDREYRKPCHFCLTDVEYALSPDHGHWKAQVWKDIVLVTVSGMWPPERWAEYFGCFWNVFCERKESWDKVYFIYETSNLPIQNEEFRNYLKENWVHLLGREDYCLSIVEPNSLKRTIWKSIYRLINIESKVQLFKDHSSALQWIQKDRSKSNDKAKNIEDESSMPKELTIELVNKQAHIRLVGKNQLWTIVAYRNIILLKIQNRWTAENIKEYMKHISGLPSLLLEEWNKIFLVFDVTLMDFAIRDAPRFLKSDWLRFMDRDDMITCVVQKNKFNRFLWRQLLRQIGKLNRVRLFSDCDRALAWIRDEMINEAIDCNSGKCYQDRRTRTDGRETKQ